MELSKLIAVRDQLRADTALTAIVPAEQIVSGLAGTIKTWPMISIGPAGGSIKCLPGYKHNGQREDTSIVQVSVLTKDHGQAYRIAGLVDKNLLKGVPAASMECGFRSNDLVAFKPDTSEFHVPLQYPMSYIVRDF